MSSNGTLGWGRALVELFLPQREPLWMVDWVLEWDARPLPVVRAARDVSANEPVFAGHFPGLPVWPGAFTVEGLAQSCRILGTLEELARGREREAVRAELAALDRALREEPPRDEPAARCAREALGALGGPGFLAATEMRFVRAVGPGCRLEYEVRLGRAFDRLSRFDVEASVGGQCVARGTITTARGIG